MLEALFFAPAVFVPKAMALRADFFDASREFFPAAGKGFRKPPKEPRASPNAQKSLVQNLFAEIRENICGNTREYFRETENLFAEIRLRFCGNKFGGRGVGKAGQAFGFAGIIEQLQEVPKI